MSILIVDDSRISRLHLCSLLREAGHTELLEASSAGVAFRLLYLDDPVTVAPEVDLILMDGTMPEIDGIQACRQIKGDPRTRDIPVIMVTGNDDEMYLRDAFAAGATDFIVKPAKGVELEARVSSALALKHEIDSRKLAYQELEKQLLQSQKLASIGRLVGGVAHDFNNVLTVIMGYSQLGLIDMDPSNDLYNKLQALLKATEHATSLTRQLLSLSSRQNGEPKVIDLNLLVLDTSKMLRRLINEDVEFITSIFEEPLQIRVDPTQIEQVLMNLTINARDAMSEGGKLTIETSVIEINQTVRTNEVEIAPGNYALLSVTDTGTGMSDEVKARIFEPFFTTKGEGKGTGLGLATCHGIVQENEGCLEVDSQLGQGTKFRVYLPIATAQKISPPPERRPDPLATGSETILFAEDEAPLRALVATILEGQGYTVLQASNGEEGLRLAQERGGPIINLLLSDIVMPQMNGIQLARRLKADRSDIKVILTSGHSDQEANMGEFGPEAVFIPKPFLPSTLANTVREVLDKNSRGLAVGPETLTSEVTHE